MSEMEKQGLQKRRTLTADEIAEITELKELCDRHDKLHMRISLDQLHQRSGQAIDDFLYYEQGTLVGYLYVDSWGQKEKEITGMVRPDFRRRGLFRQLFEAAYEEHKAHGVERLVLVCEHNSHTGHSFARAVKAHHSFAEHQMILGTFIERGQVDPQFQMRPATINDKPAIVTILTTDMGGDEDDARQMVEEIYNSSDQQLFLATLAGEPLGTLRLDSQHDMVAIYGFVVQPEFRRHGYGRQMLEYAIHRINDEAPRTIMLEVETENHRAIGLYTSCGFQIITTYDYFNRDIEHS